MTDYQQIACEGKQRFDTRAMAEKVKNRSNRNTDSARSTYRCMACGGWHIGTHLARKKGLAR